MDVPTTSLCRIVHTRASAWVLRPYRSGEEENVKCEDCVFDEHCTALPKQLRWVLLLSGIRGESLGCRCGCGKGQSVGCKGLISGGHKGDFGANQGPVHHNGWVAEHSNMSTAHHSAFPANGNIYIGSYQLNACSTANIV